MSNDNPPLTFSERVQAEKIELDSKIAKLGLFISGTVFDTLPINEQVRLRYQFMLMREYSDTLRLRLDNQFK